MTGDDRLRAELTSLEEAAPAKLPPRRAGAGRRRWVPVAMSAAVVVVAAMMVGVTLPSLLDGLRPIGSEPPAADSSGDPRLARSWQWTRHDMPGGHAWVWDMIVTGDGVVAVGHAEGEPAAWRSADGMTWERASIDDVVVDSEYYGEMAATKLSQVYEQDGQLLAIGLPQLGTPIGFVSTDGGRTWRQDERFEWREDPDRWSGGSAIIVDVISTPAGWIAAGNRATPGWAMYIRWDVAWSSPDGHVWSVIDEHDSLLGRQVERGAEVSALSFDGGTVYAVGRTIWKSDDGSRWEEAEPPVPRRRGALDGVVDRDGTLIVSEAYGEDQESATGRIWAMADESWRSELSLRAPSTINTLAEYSFGVIASGTRDGVPVAWQRNESGEWHPLPTFETERAWVGSAVEFQGRLIVSGSLTEMGEDDIEVLRQAVVWVGVPPLAPPLPLASTPPSTPDASSTPSVRVCASALASGVLQADDEGNPILILEPGSTPVSIVFSYPEDFVIESSPVLTIYDTDGNLLATKGDQVELGGGFGVGDTVFYACGIQRQQVGATIQCGLSVSDCDAALAAFDELFDLDDTGLGMVAVGIGRGVRWHAEAHACWDDGHYVLVDVFGDRDGPTENPTASQRTNGWADPPCD